MCTSDKISSKEELTSSSQIVERQLNNSESSTINSKVLQHVGAPEKDSKQSLLEPSKPVQSQDREKKMPNSCRDEIFQHSTPQVPNNQEVVHRLSPKKKRSRDQVEESKDQESQDVERPEKTEEKAINCTRASSSEPEKKRPRDTSEPGSPSIDQKAVSTQLPIQNNIEDVEDLHEKKTGDTTSDANLGSSDQATKPKLMFASSGFASLASSKVSPFGCLGSTKPSIFGGGLSKRPEDRQSALSLNLTGSSASSSSFGNLSSGKLSTPTTFGGTIGPGLGLTAGKSILDSTSGGGAFSSSVAPKLSSFATPGAGNQTLKSRETRAFGAPETSNIETVSEFYDSDDNDHHENFDSSENLVTKQEEKSKVRSKIDDGEAGEVTLLQIRAKLFAIESKSVGWKERGVGTLKINVPKSCVSYHDNGLPIPGSYDNSSLKDKNENESHSSPAARLIMRQENTHRVVLNTFILKEMEFEVKPAVSSAQFIFTAFEGEKEPKPIRLILKMSEVNAKLFKAEIDSIKRKL